MLTSLKVATAPHGFCKSVVGQGKVLVALPRGWSVNCQVVRMSVTPLSPSIIALDRKVRIIGSAMSSILRQPLL